MEFSYLIDESDSGISVDQFLRWKGYSRRLIIDLKKMEDGICVNQNRVFTNYKLTAGDCLVIHLPKEKESTQIERVFLPFPIVFEDEHLIAINKPADMPIHPSIHNYENTLANGAAWYFREKGIPFVYRCVNRLDRDTTGLVLLAKHALSGSILSQMVKERKIHREYLAAVEGVVPKAGTVDLPIGRVPGSAIMRQVDPVGGDWAVTHYEPVVSEGGMTLLRIQLETGRTHQIRVHMNAIGHPLPGDYLYHPVYDKIGRQPLHSSSLTFSHPITGAPMKLSAPVPEDMQKLFPSFFHKNLQ
jgi:23S rRNA pseudouridine1911/1915/1917 synthase